MNNIIPFPLDKPDLDPFLRTALPEEALYLGMCSDGLPALLNTDDPLNILFSERRCDFGFVVWANRELRRKFDIVRVSSDNSRDILLALCAYLHGAKKRVVLLADDAESFKDQHEDTQKNFTWLLREGHRKGLSIIANSQNLPGEYRGFFTTTIKSHGEFFVMPEKGHEVPVLFRQT